MSISRRANIWSTINKRHQIVRVAIIWHVLNQQTTVAAITPFHSSEANKDCYLLLGVNKIRTHNSTVVNEKKRRNNNLTSNRRQGFKYMKQFKDSQIKTS